MASGTLKRKYSANIQEKQLGLPLYSLDIVSFAMFFFPSVSSVFSSNSWSAVILVVFSLAFFAGFCSKSSEEYRGINFFHRRILAFVLRTASFFASGT